MLHADWKRVISERLQKNNIFIAMLPEKTLFLKEKLFFSQKKLPESVLALDKSRFEEYYKDGILIDL